MHGRFTVLEVRDPHLIGQAVWNSLSAGASFWARTVRHPRPGIRPPTIGSVAGALCVSLVAALAPSASRADPASLNCNSRKFPALGVTLIPNAEIASLSHGAQRELCAIAASM